MSPPCLEVASLKAPQEIPSQPKPKNRAATAQAPLADASADLSPPGQIKATPLTLLQANLLMAMLAGFWARKGDGHPGPDLIGRGLILLNVIVEWERIRKSCAGKDPAAKEASRKPG